MAFEADKRKGLGRKSVWDLPKKEIPVRKKGRFALFSEGEQIN